MTHPYASAAYGRAFGPGFEPLYLEQAGAWVLMRNIPGAEYQDALGCYPLSPIAWPADLDQDFDVLRRAGAVSLVLVTDPFFHPPPDALARHFDLAAPYKEHYVRDLRLGGAYSRHHRYEVRRAAKLCEIRRVMLAEHLDEWLELYRELVARQSITGIQAFSPEYFAALIPLEPVMIGAFAEGALISAHLWFEHEGYVYSHLAASSEEGYRRRAAYAVYDYSLRHFAESGASVVDLGGGAGTEEASAGLAFLKKGFSNASAMCYLCGKILDARRYEALSAGKRTAFFPAYRGA